MRRAPSSCLAALFAGVLHAQVPEEFGQPPTTLPASDGPRDWRVQVGAMVSALPRAPGSEDSRVVPWPVVSAQYRDWLWLGSSRIGVGAGAAVRLAASSWFSWELGVGAGERRREDRADELAGLGDRRGTLWAGTALRARAGIVGGSLSLASGLGQGAGTRSTAAVGLGGRLAAGWYGSAAVSASWSDARQMTFEFGIDPSQAATRAALIAAGDPRLRAGEAGPCAPGSGLRDHAATLFLACAPAPRWRLFALARAERLGGLPATSPLVRRRAAGSVGFGFSCAL